MSEYGLATLRVRADSWLGGVIARVTECACGGGKGKPHDHDCVGAQCHLCAPVLTLPTSLTFALCAAHEGSRLDLLHVWAPLIQA